MPLALHNAPKRPPGAIEQLSPLRNKLPPLLADNARATATPLAAASPLPFPATAHHPPTTRPHADVRALPAEANPLQQQDAQRPQPTHRSTLGELLAQERRQEAAERAQLVHAALPDGGEVMKRLKERATRQHPTTMAERWHARLNGAPKPIEGQRREKFEALVRADVLALAKTGRMDPLLAVHAMRAAVVEGTVGQGILAQDRQLLLDVLDQLANPVDRLYPQLKLKVTSDTLPAFTDADVLEKPTALGSGALHDVFAVKLMNPDGSVFEGVFKPLRAEKERGWVAVATGIPQDDPQIAMRNLATVAYAKKLGLDVIPDTRLAVIDTGRGPFDPDVGLIMEPARGKPAIETDASLLARPEVCAEITKLQLLDHLTGQGDRTPNNYFISIEPSGRAKVMGIDNDQCFGKDLTHPADIQQTFDGDPSRQMFRGTGLPPVIDTKMERSINALTEEDIRSMLGNKLNEAEIQAALSRYRSVKNHVFELRMTGHVIEPSQWGDPNVQQQLTVENSYVGRERLLATETPRGRSNSPTAADVDQLVAAREQVEALAAKLPQLRKHKPEIARQVEELVPVFNHALLAKDVYDDKSVPGLLPAGYSRLSPKELDGLGLGPSDLADARSGYFAAVYKTPEGRYVLANRGTTSGSTSKKDWGANFRQGAGLESDQYNHAMRTAMKIVTAAPGQVDFVGHSKGGGLAQAQALATHAKAVVFNAAALHRNTLGRHNVHNRPVNSSVSAYNVRGEVLNALQDKTPAIVPSVRGGRYELPAVKPPTQTPAGLEWKGEMGTLSTLKNTVSLHGMNSVIDSLGWQLDNLRRDAGL